MNLAAACGWTLLRSLVVVLVAVPLCWGIHRQLATCAERLRPILWAIILIPFLTPPILTGYGYSSFSLSLIRHPGWNEVLYATLVGLRSLALGVMVLHFAPPPPISPEALHCARLQLTTNSRRWRRLSARWPYLTRGPLRACFPAAAVVFLFVFQEFETASLMGITSWTVWLFDAQAGGLMLKPLLRSMIFPIGCELLVLALLLVFTFRSQFQPASTTTLLQPLSTRASCLVWIPAVAATVSVFVVPLVVVGQDTFRGLETVLRNGQMLREILVAVGFGLTAGLLASASAAMILRTAFHGGTPILNRWSRPALVLCLLLCLPGMTGSLPVSLGLLWLFQQPVFNAVYDTVIPAVVALSLFLFPRAVLLLLVFEAATQRSSVQAARLLQSSSNRNLRNTAAELLWHLRARRHFYATGLLCVWGYLEMTPISILAPPDMTTATVRLYNLMHYGHSLILSAMVLLTMLVPILLLHQRRIRETETGTVQGGLAGRQVRLRLGNLF